MNPHRPDTDAQNLLVEATRNAVTDMRAACVLDIAPSLLQIGDGEHQAAYREEEHLRDAAPSDGLTRLTVGTRRPVASTACRPVHPCG